jgi:hypothetical protein
MIGLIEHLGQIFHMRINKVEYYLSLPYVKKINICDFYRRFKKHWTYYKIWI